MGETRSITVRLPVELLDKVEAARKAHPYQPTMTRLIEVGLLSVLADLSSSVVPREAGQ